VAISYDIGMELLLIASFALTGAVHEGLPVVPDPGARPMTEFTRTVMRAASASEIAGLVLAHGEKGSFTKTAGWFGLPAVSDLDLIREVDRIRGSGRVSATVRQRPNGTKDFSIAVMDRFKDPVKGTTVDIRFYHVSLTGRLLKTRRALMWRENGVRKSVVSWPAAKDEAQRFQGLMSYWQDWAKTTAGSILP